MIPNLLVLFLFQQKFDLLITMAGSMETKLHEIEVQQHHAGGEVITGLAVPPVNSGSRVAELYQAFTDFTAGALGKNFIRRPVVMGTNLSLARFFSRVLGIVHCGLSTVTWG